MSEFVPLRLTVRPVGDCYGHIATWWGFFGHPAKGFLAIFPMTHAAANEAAAHDDRGGGDGR